MNDGIVGSPLGKSPVKPVWRMFFWAAAIYNFIVGLVGMLAPVPTIENRIIGLFVFSFGIVLVLVARDPRQFAPTLWAALIAKTGMVALLAPIAMGQSTHPVSVFVLALDAIFAIGFLVFLVRRDVGS